ncbi:hypothetical protein A2767_05630 [Candidatus Roizmanbacteria bacterium RIFCSPHIGHO2_01_FULL_35_10]|uniref:Uncharacterized protein n=1 Tax=Candidatus Roizmanbacteria bacterium RIFCSPLOWO2_01_FULL_35_13 TaxID=1802055 RepID=A0A1F7IBN2_9BACT|nr:MAG: hypothetical protein A2767_05630 [Candidatus Roizmanbacteria bacterium RIFCSPHIGHO2_01_FULL_35_10]OGK40773.1 MAG: hypothetical protein A3A74_04100 [Candidatus Roizmanbacteria bacterium RIFCSPLOWO2_01_FULL_35_13]
MCYNCGCGVPDDDMGKGKISEGGASLTEDDFKLLAEKWSMSEEEAKQNVLDLLKKVLAKN